LRLLPPSSPASFYCSFFSFLLPPLLFHSFPTRRSSDLANTEFDANYYSWGGARISHILRNPFYKGAHLVFRTHQKDQMCALIKGDRKSTRLNSSHVSISYAVFCLKKKRQTK